MIVEGAIRYFADNGFDGDTRALARSLGVSQALIFHYFPTKEQLIDRVYTQVFLSRWKVEWEEMLSNRQQSLRQRLKAFYRDYYRTADSPEWIRITLHSALRDIDINSRYHKRVRERIIMRIALELREELQLGRPDAPITDYEEQIVYALHAGLIYQLIRKHVYKMTRPAKLEPVIDVQVDLFMDAIPMALHRLLETEGNVPVAIPQPDRDPPVELLGESDEGPAP
jgi:AcrR family transcriptional regulator